MVENEEIKCLILLNNSALVGYKVQLQQNQLRPYLLSTITTTVTTLISALMNGFLKRLSM